ncbi:mucin-like protein isoform X2 [Dreissena polymorpha]|uniref:mucin-like protein isoform X2 n=1 Tax=Dreissena polymorpha TaxID=45954 RepID=UPI002263C51B|nr:mucin-like protein isoform X2 [Dreissena polymorpha]
MELHRPSKHMALFLNNGTLLKTSDNYTIGPPLLTHGFLVMGLRPPSIGFRVLPHLALNNIAMDVTTDGEFMNIRVTSTPALTNMTGLAGNVDEGSFVSQNGIKFPINASEMEMFDFGESWSLRNQPQYSKFNYNLSEGNFSTFNVFSKPRFLEHLLSNLTTLLEICPSKNVTAITADVCKNKWDSKLDKDCLLTMARTCNASLAEAVHNEVERKHEYFMRKNNRPPVFLTSMMNSTTIYKGNTSFVLNLTHSILDEDIHELRFEVGPLISDEMDIVDGVFNWTVGTTLRNMSGRTLRFIVFDKYNMSDEHTVLFRYCGCEESDQCSFRDENDAECVCQNRYSTGTFCEIKTNPCDVYRCYDQYSCNNSEYRESPCTNCPPGFYEEDVGQTQHCIDINECNNTRVHHCDHVCHNTVGSYICLCHVVYALNEDNRTCTDIDECDVGKGPCMKPHEVCMNLPGNYTCMCTSGYGRETPDAECKPKADSVSFGKLSYSIETSIHINISRIEKDISLQNSVIDTGKLSDGHPLMELLRQLGCSVGKTQISRSDTIDDDEQGKIPDA